MKKVSTLFIALAFVFGLSTASSAISIPFSQDTGFDKDSLVSDDAVTDDNDIRWNTTIPAVPGDLPGDYSIVSPTDPYFNTITWGVANDAGGPDGNNWGDSDYSGLRVLGFAGSTGVNEWKTISRVYHQNNAIPVAIHTQVSATIESTLTVGTDDVNSVPFTFEETPNSTPCSSPFPLGVCPDVFTFSAAGFLPVPFTYDGEDYIAEFDFANFVDAALDPSGAPVLSLYTREGVTSSVDIQMKINRAVPEPASMALFGTGLLGAAVRRKFFG